MCSGRFQFPFRLFLLQQTHWETCISSFLSLSVYDISKCPDAPIWLFLVLWYTMPLPGALPAWCHSHLVPCLVLGTVFLASHLGCSFHLEMFSLPLPGLLLVTLDMGGKVWGLPSRAYPPHTRPPAVNSLLEGKTPSAHQRLVRGGWIAQVSESVALPRPAPCCHPTPKAAQIHSCLHSSCHLGSLHGVEAPERTLSLLPDPDLFGVFCKGKEKAVGRMEPP